MPIFIALATLSILVMVGLGEFACGGHPLRLSALDWQPAAGGVICAAPWFKSVNWNGDEDAGSGGK
jgi:hypothetical protein